MVRPPCESTAGHPDLDPDRAGAVTERLKDVARSER